MISQAQISRTSFAGHSRSLATLLALSALPIAWMLPETPREACLIFAGTFWLLLVSYIFGAIVSSLLRTHTGNSFIPLRLFSTRLLIGHLLLCPTVYLLFFLFGVSLFKAFIGLSIVLAAAAAMVSRRAAEPAEDNDYLPILLSFAAASLLSWQTIRPVVRVADNALKFRPWPDAFFHAIQVRSFAGAASVADLFDPRCAQVGAFLYHYSSYVPPALIASISGAEPYSLATSFWMPFSVAMGYLTAYVLGFALFGRVGAIPALIAFAFFPDSRVHGIGVLPFSATWLQLTGASHSYGLAAAGAAWMFVIEGSKLRSWLLVLFGWGIFFLLSHYKAQFFIVQGPLIVGFPFLFFARRRLFGAILAAGAFCFVAAASVLISRMDPNFPGIEPDLSGSPQYALLVVGWLPNQLLELIPQWMLHSPVYLRLTAALIILFGTFGIFFWVLLFLTRKFKAGELPAPVRIFPYAVIGCYILYSLGLKFDSKGVGTPEVLNHRQFLLAYFLVSSWCGGALGLYLSKIQDAKSRNLFLIPILLMTAFGMVRQANNQLTDPWRSDQATMEPEAFISTLKWISRNTPADAVILDSGLDPYFIVGALSDRRDYVVKFYMQGVRPNAVIDSALVKAKETLALTNAPALIEAGRRLGIRIYLSRPDDDSPLRKLELLKPVFELNGYEVFDLTAS